MLTKFEIPNNLEFDLPDKIKAICDNNPQNYDQIKCFFTPPWVEDGIGVEKDNKMVERGWTRKDYLDRIAHIEELFPGKLQLIIQNNLLFDENNLKFYLDAGVRQFCVGNIEQARLLKSMDSSFNVIASITMALYDDEINARKDELLEVFDGIVLPHRYFRDLDGVKRLPEGFEYILISNTSCSCYCPGTQHWRVGLKDMPKDTKAVFCPMCEIENTFKSHMTQAEYYTWANSAIQPKDFELFLPQVNTFKIVERYLLTDHIVDFFNYSCNSPDGYYKRDFRGYPEGFYNCKEFDIDYNFYSHHLDDYKQLLLYTTGKARNWVEENIFKKEKYNE